MPRSFHRFLSLALFSTAIMALLAIPRHIVPKAESQTKPTQSELAPAKSQAKLQKVDLSAALEVALPSTEAALKPVGYRTPDGRSGWVLRLPGSRPIATPAYADGMIFVGGGYGSHEFYAIDAETGRVVWQMQTQDDGPTAAVVEDGCVAFNTESCTVIVAEAKTGKVIWQEWLGDPLMSQPAISKGRLYIAYPAGQRGAQQVQNNPTQPDSTNLGPGHR